MYTMSSTASTTTSGSDRAASSGVGMGTSLGGLGRLSERDRRVRVVRLLRPRRAAPAFGFSVRGGREYATGFFISKVEFNSEAQLQGLKVGDQLMSVNGYRVDDAIHSELVQYLSTQSRLKLKVRYVGMLPTKDKGHESLSWQFVSDRASLASDTSSSPTLCHETERLTEMRLSLLVPPRAKLGCGICKGPEWKPGIFIQFVREGGIAREAGLRPGDQILACNGYDFSNISFNEAVSAMKVFGRLELVIREGAGIELVSPESSGYNSSASSAAGERSPAPAVPHVPVTPLAPPATLRRKLASVAEEAADRADRLTMNRLKRRTWNSLEFDWTKNDIHNFDAPSDIEPDYDSPSIPNNPHTYENKNSLRNKSMKDLITSPSNRTIINLTEDGATIQCSYDNQGPRKATFTSNPSSRPEDKKTIVVEVHHTNNTNIIKPKCHQKIPPPPMKMDLLSDTSSVSSSLSSAIAEEILKRKMNKKAAAKENEVTTNAIKKLNTPKIVDNAKKTQHDALMDEFKKVHRKMFLNQDLNQGEDITGSNGNAETLERQQTLPLRKVENDTAPKEQRSIKQESVDLPPPPPPMPPTNGHTEEQRSDQKSTTKVINQKVVNGTNGFYNGHNGHVTNGANSYNGNGTLKRTPTPDYNGKPDSDVKNKNVDASKDDIAEMESLESYKLRNPLNVQPKPPPSYFFKAPNGTATMKKHARPVSVTISEYGIIGGARKEPSKLEFLNGDKTDSHEVVDDSITDRLQSELVLTLSRSNLRKKTDALADAGR